jgi:F1F0 ATPase subunit 2
MTTAAALGTGAGLGLLYFGGLWLTVRRVARFPSGKRPLIPSLAARLALAGLVFYSLSREGAAAVLFALAGFWLARTALAWEGFAMAGRTKSRLSPPNRRGPRRPLDRPGAEAPEHDNQNGRRLRDSVVACDPPVVFWQCNADIALVLDSRASGG